MVDDFTRDERYRFPMSHPRHRHSAAPGARPTTHGHVIHWAGSYDRWMTLFTLGNEAKFRRRIVEAAGLMPGERVLDVGCGTGTLALLAAERVGAEGRVVGIDPSVEMIAKAREKAVARVNQGAAAVSFEVAAIGSLPFEDASFDVVLSSLMFHHLPAEEQQSGLREVRRVLAAGGRLFIVDFLGQGPLLHRLLGRVLHRHGDRQTHRGHQLARVAQLAGELGFEDVRVSPFRPRFLHQLSARAIAPGHDRKRD